MERVSLSFDLRNMVTILSMAAVGLFGFGAIMSFLNPANYGGFNDQ